MALKITSENFETEVLQSEEPFLVDFYVDWCGPCQMQAPVIEELAEELDDVIIGKVNVDEQPELAVQFDISSIPTLLLFKNGECVSTQVGYHSKRDLITLINHFK